MNGVPRLQYLPVPATTVATAVAVPGARGEREVEPLVPAPPLADDADGGRGATRAGGGRERAADGARQGAGQAAGGEAAARRLISFSRLSAIPFMVQVLGQQSGVDGGGRVVPHSSLAGHRDAALVGSDIYRRAGGEPAVLPDGATFVRLAV